MELVTSALEQHSQHHFFPFLAGAAFFSPLSGFVAGRLSPTLGALVFGFTSFLAGYFFVSIFLGSTFALAFTSLFFSFGASATFYLTYFTGAFFGSTFFYSFYGVPFLSSLTSFFFTGYSFLPAVLTTFGA